jgi:hypothetical protein
MNNSVLKRLKTVANEVHLTYCLIEDFGIELSWRVMEFPAEKNPKQNSLIFTKNQAEFILSSIAIIHVIL